MKRIIFIIIILAASLSWTQPSLSADANYSIRSGLNFTPGLVYNRSWDPGYNGTAATLSIVRESGAFLLEAGAEAGYSYTGFNLLFPLRTGLLLTETENLKLHATAALMPGIILSRPAPYFLFAAEAAVELAWTVSPRVDLSLSAAPRYTTSPGYSKAVAPLELIDLNLGFSAGFKL